MLHSSLGSVMYSSSALQNLPCWSILEQDTVLLTTPDYIIDLILWVPAYIARGKNYLARFNKVWHYLWIIQREYVQNYVKATEVVFIRSFAFHSEKPPLFMQSPAFWMRDQMCLRTDSKSSSSWLFSSGYTMSWIIFTNMLMNFCDQQYFFLLILSDIEYIVCCLAQKVVSELIQ